MAAIAAAAVALAAAARPTKPDSVGALLAVLVVGAAAGLYPLWSNWNWHAPAANPAASGAGGPDVAAMVAKLEQRLRDEPERFDGMADARTLLSGPGALRRCRECLRSCAPTGRPRMRTRAMGLGEAMSLRAGGEITPEAAQLFEQALVAGARQSEGTAVRRFRGRDARRPGTGAHSMADPQEHASARRKSSKCSMRASRNWVPAVWDECVACGDEHVGWGLRDGRGHCQYQPCTCLQVAVGIGGPLVRLCS